MTDWSIVVPTVGRPSLHALLDALESSARGGPAPAEVVVVDDRPGREGGVVEGDTLGRDDQAVRPGRDDPPSGHGQPDSSHAYGRTDGSALPVRVVRSGGCGPAAARNVGWRSTRTTWVAFLDDDVVPEPDWCAALSADLRDLPPDVAGSQGQLRVPLPTHRRPTDWERCTAGLEQAAWITADMAYRREALAAVGGFDERFPRAYREDADLALRVQDSGARLARGRRQVVHPVRPAGPWVSVRAQAGNADDVLMRRLHGPGWRVRAGAPRGRRSRHLAVTAAALAAAGLGAAGLAASGLGATGLAASGLRAAGLAPAGNPAGAPPLWRGGLAGLAGLAALGWAVGTAELALARIRPGPRTAGEITRMVATSMAIPPAATWHTAAGLLRHRRVTPWRGIPEAVLLDRDGTLVHDVPYNGDPARVIPVEGARAALDRLRRAAVRVGVITNQSGIARGLLDRTQVEAVNARVEALLGPFDTWQVCPHGPEERCRCRKPGPGMVHAACADLGVVPERCAVVGDIGADVEAALAAGATAVLVPTAATRPAEVAAAPHTARDIGAAVDLLLAGTG